jgi:glutathione synthase/RimK-type ligase-like ATP-grasp enzyme
MESTNVETKDDADAVKTPVKPVEEKQVKLIDVEIKDENSALNVLVAFVQYAHSKGVYTIQESAKIWECINKFQGSR